MTTIITSGLKGLAAASLLLSTAACVPDMQIGMPTTGYPSAYGSPYAGASPFVASQPNYGYSQPNYAYSQPNYGYSQPAPVYYSPNVYSPPAVNNVYYVPQGRSAAPAPAPAPNWSDRTSHWNSAKRDFDHDGKPNRTDRDANGDGIPDRMQGRTMPQHTQHVQPAPAPTPVTRVAHTAPPVVAQPAPAADPNPNRRRAHGAAEGTN